MTRFEWFESGHAQCPLNLGILGADMFMKYIRYKVYLDFLSSGIDKQTAIEFTAERNKCNRSTVYRDIEFFASSCDYSE